MYRLPKQNLELQATAYTQPTAYNTSLRYYAPIILRSFWPVMYDWPVTNDLIEYNSNHDVDLGAALNAMMAGQERDGSDTHTDEEAIDEDRASFPPAPTHDQAVIDEELRSAWMNSQPPPPPLPTKTATWTSARQEA